MDHFSDLSKKSSDTRMNHLDNCGVWETKSTSKTTHFVRQDNGTLEFSVKKKKSAFLYHESFFYMLLAGHFLKVFSMTLFAVWLQQSVGTFSVYIFLSLFAIR